MQQINITKRLVMLVALMSLNMAGCDRSKPSRSQIKDYIENYQMVNDYSVESFEYEIKPYNDNQSGVVHVFGQLELAELLYVEDLANKRFRSNVAKQMRQNRFSEKEISHDIYDRVIRSATRVPDTEAAYYSFLDKEHEPGLTINFSADLSYRRDDGEMLLDGKVGYARIKGKPLQSYSHPVVDDSKLVVSAVLDVLAERDRYREWSNQIKGVIKQLWDNDHGFMLWDRKQPYAQTNDLSQSEKQLLKPLSDWHGIYFINNVKPLVFKETRSIDFYELGTYKTTGIATCLKQTGFINKLRFAKSSVESFCEVGRQYPIDITLESRLDEQNMFYTTVRFELNGIRSGRYWHDANEFIFSKSKVAKYTDEQRLEFLREPFDLSSHSRPILVSDSTSSGTGATNNRSNWFVLSYPQDGEPEIVEVESSPDESATVAAAVTADSLTITAADAGDSVEDTESVDEDAEAMENDTAAIDEPEPAVGLPVKMTKKQLATATQFELQRLKIYRSAIDGIVGKSTIWSINYFQKQNGLALTGSPSDELLVKLRATPADSASAPIPISRSARTAKQQTQGRQDKKGTVVGRMAKNTGKAIGKSFKWIGSKFKKRKEE